MVAGGVVDLVEVDAEHQVRVDRLGALGGRRQDHLPSTGLDVRLGMGPRPEPAGRLDHDIRAQLTPGQRGRVALGEHAHAATVHDERVAFHRDGSREAPVHGVEHQELCERGGVGDVVDRDDVDVGVALDRGAHDGTTDPAEAVDCNTGGHRVSFSGHPPVRSAGRWRWSSSSPASSA